MKTRNSYEINVELQDYITNTNCMAHSLTSTKQNLKRNPIFEGHIE